MNLLTNYSSRIAVVTLTCLLLPETSLLGRDFVETETADVVELLVSDRTDEAARGEKLVADSGSAYIKTLLVHIRLGAPNEKGKAAAELGIIISPWLRGKEAGARFRFTNIPAPRRPVGRVQQLAGAEDIRQALQIAILELLKAGEAEPKQTHQLTNVLRALCETLGEVASDETMNWMVERLQQIKSPALGDPLVALGDSYLGIPPLFRQDFPCGNMTSDEFEMFRKSQERALAEASKILTAKWEEVRPLNAEKRIAFSIKSWRDYFLPRQQAYSGHYFHSHEWLFLDLEPLVRLGTPAVQALRAQQAQETEIEAKALWEVVIATITGREDAELVRKLFGGNKIHWELACEVVAAATSRDWLPQLEELQLRKGFETGKASQAIALCHRNEGLPALKRGFERFSSNFHAEYAIKELEERAAIGPPRYAQASISLRDRKVSTWSQSDDHREAAR